MEWTHEDSVRYRQLRDASMIESEEMLELVELLKKRKLCDPNPLTCRNPFIEEGREAFINRDEQVSSCQEIPSNCNLLKIYYAEAPFKQ